MKKLLVIAFVMVAIFALAEINLSVFGGYAFTITSTPVDAASASYVDVALDLTYGISNQFDAGVGVGFAYFLNSAAIELIDASQNAFTLDIFAVGKYGIEIDDNSKIVMRVFGGVSIPEFNFESLGYVFGAGAFYSRKYEGMKIGLGASVEMRNYGEGKSMTSVPVGVRIDVSF